MKIMRIIFTAVVLSFIVFIGYLAFSKNPPLWTGFGESEINIFMDPAKSLWDWMELLIIPVALGIAGWALNNAEKSNSYKKESERAQNEIIDSFIKIFTQLILDKNLTKDSDIQIKIIARTRIMFALNNIDRSRKRQILQFIYESGLIFNKPTLNLNGANINNANLDEILLTNAEIRGAYFINTSMKKTNLEESIFIGCDFTNANFTNSKVKNLDLSYTNLTGVKLKNMDLTSVNFLGAIFKNTKLNNSKLTEAQIITIQIMNKNFKIRNVEIV